MRNLVFRVDSGFNIGSGHLMRCITLANYLKKSVKLKCYFIVRENEGSFNNIVIENGFNLLLIDGPEPKGNVDNYSDWLGTSQAIDAIQSLEVLKKNDLQKIDILVIDHYALDITWEKRFRSISKKIVVIDDLADRQHSCDILLDQNLAPNYKNRYNDLIPQNSKTFLGISFCLLRKDFIDAKKSIKVRTKLSNVLIFLGGVDKDNATMQILLTLRAKLSEFQSVTVIVGQSNPHKIQVKEFCNEYRNCSFHEQVSNMAEIMSQSDLAIGAGGATTGERIFLGLPSLVFSLAPNQVAVARYLHENNFITFLGDQNNIASSNIILEIDKYLDSPHLLKEQSMRLLEIGESKLSQLISEVVYDKKGNL